MSLKLGFDGDFDLTGVNTRAQARTRLIVAVVVFSSGLTAIDWRLMVLWAATFACGDGLLWIATDPGNQRRRPVTFRFLRLLATGVSTIAWVGAGVLWWFSDGGQGKAAGLALIAGVLVYMVRGCHRSLVQMLVVGTPPTTALLILPFFETTWLHRLGLLSCTTLLVAYALGSAITAVSSYAQLRKTTAALIIKRREAEAANVAKSEFLANMSHEIRTPLNGVVAMAHVLKSAHLPPRENEAAGLIWSSAQMLERLLSDILDLAKVEAGQLEIEVSSFHIGDVVRSAVDQARTLTEDKGIGLCLTVDPAAERYVQGDVVRIRQVLANLLSNAIKFTQDGSVALSLTQTLRGCLRFTVVDSGIGFDEAQKARLFERFQQADGTITRKFGGTGLGLSISRHLLELMGGVIDCHSAPGKGSTFWFELDLPPAEFIEDSEAQVEPLTISARRLLVVDDHPTNLKVAEIILAGAGVSVTTATNGQEALRIWAGADFDLILMDMQMPVMDGLAAVTEMRAAEAISGRRRTPVVMLTANASPEHVAAGQAAGADGHLTKPISPSSLFSAIELALTSPTGSLLERAA